MAGALGLSALAGLPSSAFADPPARFQPPAGIRQVQANSARVSDAPSTSSATEEEAGTGLRWKAKTVPAAQTTASTKRASNTGRVAAVGYNQPAPSRPNGWNKSRIDSTVMPAQYAAPGADPFRDPFGDRLAQNPHRAPQLVPTEPGLEEDTMPAIDESAPIEPMETTPGAPAAEIELPMETETPPATAPSGRLRNEVPMEEPMEEPAPPPRRETPLDLRPMPSVQPLPEPRTGGRSRVPCDRIYNERNCCEADEAVSRFRQQLVTDDITKISLDISPQFYPDRGPEAEAIKREDMSRKSASRKWSNFDGQLLATGRLSNIRFGKVEIADDAGAIVARIDPSQLGSDELCFISGFYRLPMEGIVSITPPQQREWIGSTYAWHASALCHKPLYFEDVQAERYGHTHGPFKQPFVSGAHFFVNIAALPYKMAINPPNECQYALGYYRPGSCAPYHIMPVPLSVRAGLVEAGAIVGGIAILP